MICSWKSFPFNGSPMTPTNKLIFYLLIDTASWVVLQENERSKDKHKANISEQSLKVI